MPIRRLLAAFLVLTPCVAAHAGDPAPATPPQSPTLAPHTIIAGDAFAADLRLMRRAYEALHPGLYRSATPEQVAQRFDDLERAAARGITLADAYIALTRLTASLRCGHTYPNFFNQSDAVHDALFTGVNRLPFYFRWLDRRMIVTRSFVPDLSPGDEIVSINGEPAPQILDELLPLARADGGNDFRRVASLESRGDATLETFDVLTPLLRPSWRDTFELVVRDPASGDARQARVAAHSDRDRADAFKAASPANADKAAPAWRFETIRPGVALLVMPTWAMYNSKWNWQAWLDERVDTLIDTRTAALIVDLRGNEGGNDCGDALIARLIDRELEETGRERYVCYQTVPADLNPHLNTWDDSFRDRTAQTTPAPAPALLAGGGRSFYLLAEANPGRSKVIAPRGRRYTGKVVVLIDSVCSSATFQFAALVQRAKLATLVGEPTGGNLRGLNGGAYFFMTLPNSQLEVDVPLISYIAQGPTPPDSGVTPDVTVPVTPSDLRQGRDPQLEEAIRLAGTP